MRKKKKKNFLKTICPFRVLEDQVTWGEFIAINLKGLFGAALMFAFCLEIIIVADLMGVAG